MDAFWGIAGPTVVGGIAVFFLKRYVKQNDESLEAINKSISDLYLKIEKHQAAIQLTVNKSHEELHKISEELSKEIVSLRVLTIEIKSGSTAAAEVLKNKISSLEKDLKEHEDAFRQLKKVLQAYRIELDELKLRD